MRANDRQRPQPPRRKRGSPASRRVAPLAALILAATACTGPARTTSEYQAKSVDTADEVVSASRTVLLVARLGDEERSFATTIAVTVTDAESDADTARDAFTSIQPPDAESDQLRAALLPTVEQACDVIAEVRIAARRSEGGLSQIAAPLEQLADQLDAFSTRYGGAHEEDARDLPGGSHRVRWLRRHRGSRREQRDRRTVRDAVGVGGGHRRHRDRGLRGDVGARRHDVEAPSVRCRPGAPRGPLGRRQPRGIVLHQPAHGRRRDRWSRSRDRAGHWPELSAVGAAARDRGLD